MAHWLATLGNSVLAPILVAGLLFIGHKINKRLKQFGSMPEALAQQAVALTKLADAVAKWEEFRHTTEDRLEVAEDRIDQHGRVLANQHQRITLLEVRRDK